MTEDSLVSFDSIVRYRYDSFDNFSRIWNLKIDQNEIFVFQVNKKLRFSTDLHLLCVIYGWARIKLLTLYKANMALFLL